MTSLAIVLFTISTMSLLACLFLFSYVISAWTKTPTAVMAQACYGVIAVARLAFTTGTVMFTAGVAALGWMHSRRMGTIAALCALVALLLMVWSGLRLGNPAG